ncbi:MAG: two-component system sensor histidine kinase CreC [Proteobacteria bacterium]|nr:two-component system sensor histidine kinase CreC [Pseudomonadota bacterium]
MKLGVRIFICSLLIFVVCFYPPINWILDNLRIRYLEGVEDPLVDQANILASIVGIEMESGSFNPEKFDKAFKNVYARNLSAGIYDLLKTEVDIRVYITDNSGKVIFNSYSSNELGKDYSNWRDVYLTLVGGYGARSTLENEDDSNSSVLHVAAPIMVNNKIAGVLTVAKPTTNINNFLRRAKPRIIGIGAISLLAAIFMAYLVSIWITRPIIRLTNYANGVGAGKRPAFPKLDKSEVGELGNAFIKMQEALEGKKYVEQYIQNLTHEIKGPLSGIRGAAELLQEDMPPDKREQFLANIRFETNRIQGIVDQMLELSVLENLKSIQKSETLTIHSLVKTVLESKKASISIKKVSINFKIKEDIFIQGDSFLLHQAISNLIQNAVDFSMPHEQIELTARTEENNVIFEVADNGPGIPDYAGDKIFDKFFSLQRPDTGKKSTGLGLNFARQVAILHNGDVFLENRSSKGVVATMVLPITGKN